MKKFNWVMVFILVLVLGVIFGIRRNWLSDSDYRIGLVGKDGLGLVSVSFQRKMVNLLIIPLKTQVWVPFGPGRYEVDKLAKLFELDNQQKSKKMLFVYNWGFVPDEIIDLEKVVDWELVDGWWHKWGIMNWLRYKLGQGEWWFKTETLKGSVTAANGAMVDTISRDFSDAIVVGDTLKLSVYNDSGADGLAGFLGNLIDLSGVTVVGVENSDGGLIEGCKMLFSKKSESKRSIYILKNMFPECSLEISDKIREDLAEIYFGEKFAQMLNYESYKQ